MPVNEIILFGSIFCIFSFLFFSCETTLYYGEGEGNKYLFSTKIKTPACTVPAISCTPPPSAADCGELQKRRADTPCGNECSELSFIALK